MNRDEFEQKFQESAKSIWSWSQGHTLAAAVIVALVVGFVLGKLL